MHCAITATTVISKTYWVSTIKNWPRKEKLVFAKLAKAECYTASPKQMLQRAMLHRWMGP
jgi:hypothetical protein